MDIVGAPVKQIKHFSSIMPVMSHDLALLRGAPQLEVASADLWTLLLKTLYFQYMFCFFLI
jgi:hypothetical protein